MSRLFDSASLEKLGNFGNTIPPPFTLAGWGFAPSDTGSTHTLMSQSRASRFKNRHTLSFALGSVGNPGHIYSQSESAGSGSAATTNSVNIGAWNHICGRWAATNNRSVVLNGDIANIGISTANSVPVSLGYVTIGMHFYGGTQTWSYNDKIGECGMWDVALTDSEVEALAAGVSPLRVRPASLVSYWPLTGRVWPEPDLLGARPLTSSNGTAYGEHVPLIKPSNTILQFPAQGRVWVNDAPSYDAGAVQQTYTGWTSTGITVGQVIDTTGLTGQLYLGIERTDGRFAWHTITVKNLTITSVSSDDILPRTETDWVIAGTYFGAR